MNSMCMNMQKSNSSPISSHLDRTSLVNKGLNFLAGDWAILSGLDTILSAPVAKVNAGFGSPYTLVELAV